MKACIAIFFSLFMFGQAIGMAQDLVSNDLINGNTRAAQIEAQLM